MYILVDEVLQHERSNNVPETFCWINKKKQYMKTNKQTKKQTSSPSLCREKHL